MARSLRIEYEGATYHVINRGIARRALFRNDSDFERFTENLVGSAELHRVQIHAYSLLDNHFHLLITTPCANLGAFMLSLETRYGVYFNRKYNQSGHVYQGRYKPLLVEENAYLKWLSRYIHLNPVNIRFYKGKVIEERRAALRAYPWSSYPDYARYRKRRDWLEYELLAHASGSTKEGSRVYRNYIESGLAEDMEEWEREIRKARLAIGTDSYLEQVQERYDQLVQDAEVCPEDVAGRMSSRRLDPDVILDLLCKEWCIQKTVIHQRRGGGVYRGIAARMLVKYAGMTQREVARNLGMGTGSAVSIRIKTLAEQAAGDTKLALKLKRFERRLKEML